VFLAHPHLSWLYFSCVVWYVFNYNGINATTSLL